MKGRADYSPAIDGLRLLAFAMVFLHHLPPGGKSWLTTLTPKGWYGVDLFFAISAFLLFRSLLVEHARYGHLAIGSYFWRRVARIYPLMMLYAIAVTAIFGKGQTEEWWMLGAYLLSLDNFLWVAGLSAKEVAVAGHLWSLSFEFQLYLLIPVLMLTYLRAGRRAFLLTLAGICVYAVLARQMTFYLGAKHPTVYMTPFLRPESFLAGIALAVLRPAWSVYFSGIGCLAAVAGLVVLDQPWETATSSVFTYPLIGIAAGAMIDLATRSSLTIAIFGWKPIAYMGERSFGLYVFHLVPIVLITKWLYVNYPNLDLMTAWYYAVGSCIAVTTLCAVLSYQYIEGPIYRMAGRAGRVHNDRADKKSAGMNEGRDEARQRDPSVN